MGHFLVPLCTQMLHVSLGYDELEIHGLLFVTIQVSNHENEYIHTHAVADPGFPVGGGVDLLRGSVDL